MPLEHGLSSFYTAPSVILTGDVKIGTGTRIWHFSHILDNTDIGEGCNIGQNVVIGPNVLIGNNVKIQNNVSVYDGVTLEDQVFVGPSVVFTNDLYPRSHQIKPIVPTLIEQGASIGANSTIICGVTLGKWCLIGAGSVVTRDVPDFGLWVGTALVGKVDKDGYPVKVFY